MGRRRENMTPTQHRDMRANMHRRTLQSIEARRAWAADRMADVVTLVERGESWAAICRQLEVSDEALTTFCRRHGRSDLRALARRDDTYVRLTRLRRDARRVVGLAEDAREEDFLRALIRSQTRRAG